MHHFTPFTLVSLTISVAVLAVPVAVPATWETAFLEPYTTYHDRYLALGCDLKHNSTFFDQCCHPLLANRIQPLSAQCIPPSGSQVPSPESKKATPPSASTTPASQKPAIPPSSAASAVYKNGFATYFYQNGVAGACGTVHSDSDFIAAIDAARYGYTGVKSGLCGKQVSITNADNGHTVVVTIADACPTCDNSNSIDLSVAAFERLDLLSVGIVPITWSFV